MQLNLGVKTTTLSGECFSALTNAMRVKTSKCQSYACDENMQHAALSMYIHLTNAKQILCQNVVVSIVYCCHLSYEYNRDKKQKKPVSLNERINCGSCANGNNDGAVLLP